MSARALLLACRNHLRTLLSLDNESCDVMLNGMPKAMRGQTFVAVHLASWRTQSEDADLDERFEVAVTVTYELGVAPSDRWGTDVWLSESTGLDALCRKIIVGTGSGGAAQGLHRNETLMDAINVLVGAGNEPFQESMTFSRADPPRFQEANWFFSGLPAPEGSEGRCGLSQTLYFSARRLQGLWPYQMS